MNTSPFPISEETLIDTLELPIHPRGFDFDFTPIAKRLGELFQIETPHVEVQPGKKLSLGEAKALLSDAVLYERISLSSCSGHLYWIAPKTSVKHFAHFALGREEKEDELISNDLLEGFKRFIAAELLFLINQDSVLGPRSAQIEHKEPVTSEGFLYELVVVCNQKRLACSIFLTEDFLKDFNKERSARTPLEIPEDVKKSVKAPIGLNVGHFSLSAFEFLKVRSGDFVILDRCTLDPDTGHGNLTLTFKEHSLFRAKLKEGNLKILDYSLEAAGEINAMDDIPTPPENPIEPHLNPEHKVPPKDIDHAPLDSPMESHDLEQPWIDGEDLSPPMDIDVEKPSLQKTELSSREIPLNIRIEVGRLQIPLERLLALAPGQVLELGLHIDEGVSCMIGDKKVASGELVKLGDTIGVRIKDVATIQT